MGAPHICVLLQAGVILSVYNYIMTWNAYWGTGIICMFREVSPVKNKTGSYEEGNISSKRILETRSFKRLIGYFAKSS